MQFADINGETQRALTDFGIGGNVEKVNVSSISHESKGQARAKTVTERVQKYKEEMLEGDVFPMIVVNQHYAVVDGVHRFLALVEAASVLGVTEVLVFVADLGHLTTADLRELQIRLNMKHGMAMEPGDYEPVVLARVEAGIGRKEVAKRLGLSHGQVERIVNTDRATREMSRVGFRGDLPRNVADAIAQGDNTDIALRNVASLVNHCGRGKNILVNDLVDAIRRARKARNDSEVGSVFAPLQELKNAVNTKTSAIKSNKPSKVTVRNRFDAVASIDAKLVAIYVKADPAVKESVRAAEAVIKKASNG